MRVCVFYIIGNGNFIAKYSPQPHNQILKTILFDRGCGFESSLEGPAVYSQSIRKQRLYFSPFYECKLLILRRDIQNSHLKVFFVFFF